MTHNELLSKIDKLPEVIGLAEFKVRHDALRAVVELHKSKSSEYFEEDVCETCSYDLDYFTTYPCPTIQAIEKEIQ